MRKYIKDTFEVCESCFDDNEEIIFDNYIGGYQSKTIPQRYWEELYTGIEDDDVYDYECSWRELRM